MCALIAFCGLDCSACEAYINTQANDLEAQEALLAKWRVEFNAPDMSLADVTCDGCTSTGRLGGYCSMCEIRSCSVERGMENCAHCADYGCEKLAKFFEMAPHAKVNLDALRLTLN